MSSSYYYYPTYPTTSTPINVPGKAPQYQPTQYGPYSRISASPPEAPESVSAGTASATASTYAGSASDYDSASSSGTASVDLLDYMSERLNGAFNPIPLDRNLVTQAQTSGELNAKQRKLMELQARAQQRLAAVQMEFSEGINTAREVQRDLQWTQKRVTALNQRAARKYPKEYAMAQQRYPTVNDDY